MSGEEKIRHYLNRAFYGIQQTKEIQEEKEALLAELLKKYQALIEEGYEPENAYQTVISGIGDIFELVDCIAGKSASAPQSPSDLNIRPSKETSPVWEALPYAAAGVFLFLYLLEFIFPAGPRSRMILPMLFLGAALGSAVLWLILCPPKPASLKNIPFSHVLTAAIWFIAALLFLYAVSKPHLARILWLIPLGALALSQIISTWISYQNDKKRGAFGD